jgi:hypothetical protein
MKKSVFLILTIIVFSGVLITLAQKAPDLQFTVDEVKQDAQSVTVAFLVQNNTESYYSFGWGSSCYITVVTDVDTYTQKIRNVSIPDIGPGINPYSMSVSCLGNIQTITLTDILKLKSSGTPDTRNPLSFTLYDIHSAKG